MQGEIYCTANALIERKVSELEPRAPSVCDTQKNVRTTDATSVVTVCLTAIYLESMLKSWVGGVRDSLVR